MFQRERILLTVLILFFFGCSHQSTGAPSPYGLGTGSSSLSGVAVHHTVVRGETLWRIAQKYDVSVDKIVRANRLRDVDSIEVGQRLTIPVKAQLAAGKRPRKKFKWPTKGSVVVRFGEKEEGTISKGIGIRADMGSKVVAAQSGVVSFVGDKVKGYGKMVIIDHGDGFESVYAHNSENLVRLGEKVKKGQSIALVGKSGRAKFPYLYFELRWRHQPQDPLLYLG